MVRKHDKHEKARGKDRKDAGGLAVQEIPKICGCPVPDPVTCSIGLPLPTEEEGGLLMECSNTSCPFKEHRIHPACFTAYEDHLVKIISNLGSARGWTDAQRRANMWEKKGQSLVAKVCRCRCGLGTTRRDEMAFYSQEQKRRQAEEIALGLAAGAKKKKEKTKALPKLNFGLIRGSPAAHAEERESRILTRRLNGRQRDQSTSSVTSTTYVYDYEHRDSTYGYGDTRALSVMSGNVADQDDSMSTCSRNDVFPDPAVELVPAPLPPPQTRSYASAIKRTDSPIEVEAAQLSIQTDMSVEDSGVEMKSGSSTGSEYYDSAKEPLSPSPTLGMRNVTERQPLTMAQAISLPDTPKSNRSSKSIPRKLVPVEMPLSLFAESDVAMPNFGSATRNGLSTSQLAPGAMPTIHQQLTPGNSPAHVGCFSDLFKSGAIGSVAATPSMSTTAVLEKANWTPLFGTGFGFGETLLSNTFLPGCWNSL